MDLRLCIWEYNLFLIIISHLYWIVAWMSEEREHAYRTPDSAQDSSQWSCFAAGLCFRCMGCERKWACVLLRDQDVVVWVVLLYIYRVCAFVVFRHELQNSSCCDRNGGLHQCVHQLWMAARCIEFVEFVLLLLLKRSRNQSLSKANQWMWRPIQVSSVGRSHSAQEFS